MICMAGYDIPMRALRQQIGSSLQLIVQAQRLTGGKRRVTKVTEITGMEGENLQTHDLFLFEQTGVDASGHAVGHFTVTGIRPRCYDKIESRGISLPLDLFHRRKIDGL
jgi:pilus assembly protein CpaF